MTGQQTSQATYGGSLVAVVGGATLNEVVALCGLGLAVALFIANLVYRQREDRRAAERHAAARRGWERDGAGSATGTRQARADAQAAGRAVARHLMDRLGLAADSLLTLAQDGTVTGHRAPEDGRARNGRFALRHAAHIVATDFTRPPAELFRSMLDWLHDDNPGIAPDALEFHVDILDRRRAAVHLRVMLAATNARRGEPGKRAISLGTPIRWRSDYEAAGAPALAPNAGNPDAASWPPRVPETLEDLRQTVDRRDPRGPRIRRPGAAEPASCAAGHRRPGPHRAQPGAAWGRAS